VEKRRTETAVTIGTANPPAPAMPTDESDALDGWQALAVAELGRTLDEHELAQIESQPAERTIDQFFPHLSTAARSEALWALG
jgi:hypothetical protein